jgi:hypothetical protein
MYKELATLKAKKYVPMVSKAVVEYYERPPMITVKEYRKKRGID